MISDAFVNVECDRCGMVQEEALTAIARGGYDGRDLERLLKREGWEMPNGVHGETICPDCAEQEDEDDDGAVEAGS